MRPDQKHPKQYAEIDPANADRLHRILKLVHGPDIVDPKTKDEADARTCQQGWDEIQEEATHRPRDEAAQAPPDGL